MKEQLTRHRKFCDKKGSIVGGPGAVMDVMGKESVYGNFEMDTKGLP